jgi:hypothetical protein
VCRSNPTVDELKDEITAVVENISEETLIGEMENFSRRLQIIDIGH